MVFVKEIFKHCESRIYLLEHASAITLTLRSATFGAKSLTVVRAEQSRWKSEQKLLAERLVNVKLVAVENDVFVSKLLKLILVYLVEARLPLENSL